MSEYTAHCLNTLMDEEDPGETYTVNYELHEYYYTLYYYDQAGNLVISALACERARVAIVCSGAKCAG